MALHSAARSTRRRLTNLAGIGNLPHTTEKPAPDRVNDSGDGQNDQHSRQARPARLLPFTRRVEPPGIRSALRIS